MDKNKKQIVENFISGCGKNGLSIEECIELSAHVLITCVSASGTSDVKVTIENVGTVDVEC